MQVTNEVGIDGPVEAVFDMVTTTRHWPAWHPATLEVGGVTDRPIALGDRIRERARIGGQEYDGDWTVVEHDRPRRVVLQVLGSGTSITYAFRPEGPGTRFTRTLDFEPAEFAGSAADPAALQRVMHAQSEEALGRLKQLVEAELARA